MKSPVHTLLFSLMFFAAWQSAAALDAQIGEVRIQAPYNQSGKTGVRIEIRNAVIKGMQGRQVVYSAQASQGGKAIDEVVSTQPAGVSSDPAYEALPAHFFYTFDELKEKGDESKPYTFTVWIVNAADENDFVGATNEYAFEGAAPAETADERAERFEKELAEAEDPLKEQTMGYLESLAGENVASMAEPAVEAVMTTMQERVLKDLAAGKLPDSETWDSFKDELVDGYKGKIVELAMAPLTDAAKGRYLGLCEAKAGQLAGAIGFQASRDEIGRQCMKIWGKIQDAVQDKVKDIVFEKLIPAIKEKMTAFFQKKSQEMPAKKEEPQEQQNAGGLIQLTRLLSKPGSLGGFYLFWNPVQLGKDDYLDIYAAESPDGPWQKCSWLAYPDPASGGSESHSKVNRCPFSMQYDTTYYFRVRVMGPGRTDADVSNVVSGLQRRN